MKDFVKILLQSDVIHQATTTIMVREISASSVVPPESLNPNGWRDMAPAAPWNGSFKHAHLSSRPTGSCDRHTRSTRPVWIWDIADISAMANQSMPVSEAQERPIDLDALLFWESYPEKLAECRNRGVEVGRTEG